jgi:hypothetical protein
MAASKSYLPLETQVGRQHFVGSADALPVVKDVFGAQVMGFIL